jgi:dTDP-4-amino-4,6-dideoxygalactose transaminase
MCDVHALVEICRAGNLALVEDAAHAHGAEWNGRRAGSFGLAASFSFQNGKVLTAGEGGMLVTSDAHFAERARSISNCGRMPGRSFYEHHELGTNFRLSGWQAAVLLAQLESLPQQTLRRESNARLLNHLLANCKGLVWQRQPSAQTQNPYYLLTGRVDSAERDRLCACLAAAGIPATPFYPHTLYQNPVYRRSPCRVMPCPVAEARVHDSFWLAHRALLAEEETIHEIADVMRGAATGRPVSSLSKPA